MFFVFLEHSIIGGDRKWRESEDDRLSALIVHGRGRVSPPRPPPAPAWNLGCKWRNGGAESVQTEGKKENTRAQKNPKKPLAARNSESLPLALPLLICSSSGEGSLGEIQTLQECYRCVALAAFPGSLNTLQTLGGTGLPGLPHFSSDCVRVSVCVCLCVSLYRCTFTSADSVFAVGENRILSFFRLLLPN